MNPRAYDHIPGRLWHDTLSPLEVRKLSPKLRREVEAHRRTVRTIRLQLENARSRGWQGWLRRVVGW